MNARVLAVLDDAGAARRLIDWASALARTMQRPLEVVYVESEQALAAASLPFTQVLAHGATSWQPLQPADVERGYRAEQARLRQMLEGVELREQVSCSLSVVRGAVAQVALHMHAGADVLLCVPAGRIAAATTGRALAARGHTALVVEVLADDTAAGQAALRAARDLAQALGAQLSELAPAAGSDVAAVRGDVLVLPRTRVGEAQWRRLAVPLVLVG